MVSLLWLRCQLDQDAVVDELCELWVLAGLGVGCLDLFGLRDDSLLELWREQHERVDALKKHVLRDHELRLP